MKNQLKLKIFFIKEGSRFGLRGFVTNRPRRVCIKSLKVTHLAYIEQ
jgi:hypothetical protein